MDFCYNVMLCYVLSSPAYVHLLHKYTFHVLYVPNVINGYFPYKHNVIPHYVQSSIYNIIKLYSMSYAL